MQCCGYSLSSRSPFGIAVDEFHKCWFLNFLVNKKVAHNDTSVASVCELKRQLGIVLRQDYIQRDQIKLVPLIPPIYQ